MALISSRRLLFNKNLKNFYLISKGYYSNSDLFSKLEKSRSLFVNCILFPKDGLKLKNFRSIFLSSALMKKERVSITFIKHDGTQVTGIGKEGESILDVVVNNDIDLGGYGACEGTLSCSTCHVIFKPEDFEKLSDKSTDEELDMLDLAPEVCEMSRLGCQVYVTKEMNGVVVRVPAVVRDAREFPAGTDSANS